MRKQGCHPMNYHSKTLSRAKFNYRHYAKELYLMMQDLEKWRPYLQEGKTLFHWLLSFRVLSWISISSSQKYASHLDYVGISTSTPKQWAEHRSVHNLSHKHTLVAASLQVTSDHSKQHHLPYMVSKQCQPPVTCKVDDNHDSAGKVPLVRGQRKDTSRYKKGVIGPPGRESPFPGQLVENYIVIWSLKSEKQGVLKEITFLISDPCQC